MSKPPLTREIAWSAAVDVANARMRAAGRTSWTRKDYDAACHEFNRLWPNWLQTRIAGMPRASFPRELRKGQKIN